MVVAFFWWLLLLTEIKTYFGESMSKENSSHNADTLSTHLERQTEGALGGGGGGGGIYYVSDNNL